MSRSRTIAFVGGGAMGGAFAARLKGAGERAVIVDVSAELVGAIQRSGITVDGPAGEVKFALEATTDPATVGYADVVFVFVKAQHTAAAAELMQPLVGPSTVVVSLQNGWGNADILAGRVAPERLVIGVTYHSATVVGLGHVRHSGQGQTFVGPYVDGGALDRAEAVGVALRRAGMDVMVTADVKTEIWRKLVLNAATLPTAALTTLRAGELGEPGPMLGLVDAIAAEVVAVARAQGYAIDLDERLQRIHATLEGAGAGKPSMLQDVEAHRKTEVERVNGAVVTAADELGIEVPLNRALVALIGGLERSWGRAS